MSQPDTVGFGVNHNAVGITAWGFQSIFEMLGINAKVRSITTEDKTEYYVTLAEFSKDKLASFDPEPERQEVPQDVTEKSKDVGNIR